MYRWLRPGLFCLPPELAHACVLHGLRWMPKACFSSIPAAPVQAMGLTFPHRIGLAAGLDKTGAFVDALQKLSFAFIEVGTITPQPQAGNARPRLFRLPSDQAIINRMGFNNPGLARCVQHLKQASSRGVVGVNIGKQKSTPVQAALGDYVVGLQAVYSVADYVTINISSPNTQDLRVLQQSAFLADLLQGVAMARERLMDETQRRVPLVIKCSPDESPETLKQLAEQVLKHGIDGIIATNTTVSRAALSSTQAGESGGLSGQPLFEPATQTLRLLKQAVGDAVTLIASGGVMSAEAAQAKLAAGATLIQLYTGLIYTGPALIRACAKL